jgi:hypothetical protein
MKNTAMTSLITPLPHHSARLTDAIDEILEVSDGPTSVVVFRGDEGNELRSLLLLSDPERLHFLWPTRDGVVAVRDESESESVIWAETARLRWEKPLSVGVAGPSSGQDGAARFRAAFVAMGKARSLGGALTIAACALLGRAA